MTQDHDHDQAHDQHGRRHGRPPATEVDTPATAAPDLAATLGNRGVERVLRATDVQRDGATTHQELDEAVARSIEDRRGKGQPLDDDTRADMEGALGADLEGVRVHTDGDAHDLNTAVAARAFTSGDDVFFGSGTYEPSSSSGRELLAHELTHVVQQRTGTSGLDGGQVSDPADAAEVEASAVGAAVRDGAASAGSSAPATAGVAREADDEEEEMQLSVAREADEDEEEMQLSVAREAIEEEELEM